MNGKRIFSLLAIALSVTSIAAIGLVSAARAQTAEQLVGTWQLVSNINTAADGTKTDGFGAHGIGTTIFESNGRFALININPDVPKFTSNNRGKGTPDENKAVIAGTLAYFGTYTVDGKILNQKIEGSTYPNWNGTEEKRTIISLKEDDLKYSVGVPTIGGQTVTTWKRIK